MAHDDDPLGHMARAPTVGQWITYHGHRLCDLACALPLTLRMGYEETAFYLVHEWMLLCDLDVLQPVEPPIRKKGKPGPSYAPVIERLCTTFLDALVDETQLFRCPRRALRLLQLVDRLRTSIRLPPTPACPSPTTESGHYLVLALAMASLVPVGRPGHDARMRWYRIGEEPSSASPTLGFAWDQKRDAPAVVRLASDYAEGLDRRDAVCLRPALRLLMDYAHVRGGRYCNRHTAAYLLWEVLLYRLRPHRGLLAFGRAMLEQYKARKSPAWFVQATLAYLHLDTIVEGEEGDEDEEAMLVADKTTDLGYRAILNQHRRVDALEFGDPPRKRKASEEVAPAAKRSSTHS